MKKTSLLLICFLVFAFINTMAQKPPALTKDDRTNYILSGTFEFTAANTDSTNDIVTITDGRFDISYKR